MSNRLVAFEDLYKVIDNIASRWRDKHIAIEKQINDSTYDDLKDDYQNAYEQSYKFYILETLIKEGKIDELIDSFYDIRE